MQEEKEIIDLTLDDDDEPAEMALKVLKRVTPAFLATNSDSPLVGDEV
jgi:hypothetical protein